MKLYNIGSINKDFVYRLSRLPAPGETLAAQDFSVSLGGKGTNISVAVARAGGSVCHIGAVGQGDQDILDMLQSQGVDCGAIDRVSAVTGHAVVYVDDNSENQIVIVGGANHAISEAHIRASLAGAVAGDWLLLQNETTANDMGLKIAREKGMKVALVAAPFDAETLPDLIQRVDFVSMNKTEIHEFEAAIGRPFRQVDGTDFLITYGADGAEFVSGGVETKIAAHKVTPVDTTGAGDTFFGAFMAKYAAGDTVADAMTYASAAAALQVQRLGASVAIPQDAEVQTLLKAASNAND